MAFFASFISFSLAFSMRFISSFFVFSSLAAIRSRSFRFSASNIAMRFNSSLRHLSSSAKVFRLPSSRILSRASFSSALILSNAALSAWLPLDPSATWLPCCFLSFKKIPPTKTMIPTMQIPNPTNITPATIAKLFFSSIFWNCIALGNKGRPPFFAGRGGGLFLGPDWELPVPNGFSAWVSGFITPPHSSHLIWLGNKRKE